MGGPSVTHMADRRRKPRGTAKNRQPLYLEVDPQTVDKITSLASVLGRSKAATLDLILTHTEVDDDGRPTFWDGPLADDMDERLPIAL